MISICRNLAVSDGPTSRFSESNWLPRPTSGYERSLG